ncbi:hypothetical protein BpHYR1_031397 [Brachionus plicatilis]|uniref:Uncharacterized protein n=1 Tax=Brachionus plicatilis TaxID=10195 RepID=A0A3M7RVU2_BRAPC|nr:hypothetical protein BpHYR1_031397 [Brachionus plicatilis]
MSSVLSAFQLPIKPSKLPWYSNLSLFKKFTEHVIHERVSTCDTVTMVTENVRLRPFSNKNWAPISLWMTVVHSSSLLSTQAKSF